MSLVHTRFFLPLPPSCPSSSVTMGKVCVSHDTLLITDDDSTTQDDKSLPPCMQLQAGVGFNFLPSTTNPPPRLQLRDGVGFFPPFFSSQRTTTTTTSYVGSLSSSVSVCTHDNDENPPPRLQLRDGVGFYYPFFLFLRQRTTSHVGSSLSSASICTHDNPTTHPLACNCETGWVFYHPFFRVNERQRRRRAMQARCRHLRPASVCTHSRRPL